MYTMHAKTISRQKLQKTKVQHSKVKEQHEILQEQKLGRAQLMLETTNCVVKMECGNTGLNLVIWHSGTFI